MTTLTNKTEERRTGALVYSFATPHDRNARKTLFVNMIPQFECVNNCRFCSRADAIAGRPNIYERKAGTSLYLPAVPTPREIIPEIGKMIRRPNPVLFGLDGTREIAIVGLGEPLMNLDDVIQLLWSIKKLNGEDLWWVKTRLDTNGLVNAMYAPYVFGCSELVRRYPAEELKHAGLDRIRISVNAINSADYNALCRPPEWLGKVTLHGSLAVPKRFVKDPFTHVCDFVKDCIKAGIKTSVSFVVGFESPETGTRTAEEYRAFAKKEFKLKPSHVIIRQYVPPSDPVQE
jgi:MoaA/NifB/PqqE/SkfB family radical SAM enzyme